ncbi:MAG TPA: hypothetical protein P5246_06280 [Candidatus Omnitrophota bacterium]|jgi:hypothetical protein|nr:hypothetical protein [Candidatus Omnitrophota bacterium]HSA31474.1 hypothetical protein [Candidatus Omnitrophota bacterium]
MSPHPIELYERGIEQLNSTARNVRASTATQEVFLSLIKKFPYSPLGYLGMSYCYRHDAYVGAQRYDIEFLKNNAYPLALKALRLGPSIRAVHENYAFFQELFFIGEGENF